MLSLHTHYRISENFHVVIFLRIGEIVVFREYKFCDLLIYSFHPSLIDLINVIITCQRASLGILILRIQLMIIYCNKTSHSLYDHKKIKSTTFIKKNDYKKDLK